MGEYVNTREERSRVGGRAEGWCEGGGRKGGRWKGILRDSQQKGGRGEEWQTMENGWTIVRLAAETLTLTTGKNCAPPQWRWLRQGAANEAMDSHNTDSLEARLAVGKSGEIDAGG
ncbi:HofP DNA utilization family protein [Salmonella enterica]|uniref:HofP DNA utilization family protein n=1 Tax=Salmonella enterica TaxID=28901 RepID=UPI00398C2C04